MASKSTSANEDAHVTAWSILTPSNPLPPVSSVKRICIIDFDNTLYRSPVPSNIWESSSLGILREKDYLLGGGWWQTPSILDATIAPDDGNSSNPHESVLIQRYPDRWNKPLVEIARKAELHPDTLNVLLTGRDRAIFSKTMLRLLNKVDFGFDLVVLKQVHPQLGTVFPTTMEFKQQFISMLLKHYDQTENVSIYEDRPGHTKQFKDFGDNYNRLSNRQSPKQPFIKFDVIQVQPAHCDLEPLEEIKQVKFMLQRHNKMIHAMDIRSCPTPAKLFKRVCHTSYMLDTGSTDTLLEQFHLKPRLNSRETDFFGRYIPIKIGRCEPSQIEDLGGMGARVQFETIGFGSHNECVWAVRVRPVSPNAKVLSVDAIPTILLAKRTDVTESLIHKIQNWKDIHPGDPQYLRFHATVGEQLRLHISARRAFRPRDMRRRSDRP